MRVWDDEAVQILRDCYPDHDTDDVAVLCGSTASAVRRKAFELGIKKSIEGLWKANVAAMAKGGNKGWFPKGHLPENKGTKGLYVQTEGCIRTQFKKGHIPANTKSADGVISIRANKRGVPTKYIRIGLGKWRELSRYTYELTNGPVPQRHVIRFRDGNSLNCDPENLECISSRLNMLLNSKHGYSREIAEVRETLCELKSIIKGDCDENQHD